MNNEVKLIGIAKDENHIESTRPSGIVDCVPVSVPLNMVGQQVVVDGEFVSYNTLDRKLKLYVRPYNINFSNEEDVNKIHIEGYVCKAPIYRKTPSGRKITDLLIAVNHGTESSYLPCVFWGDASYLDIGDLVKINGRIQSREYLKNDCIHTAYEVSIEELS